MQQVEELSPAWISAGTEDKKLQMYLCPHKNHGRFISLVKPYLSAQGSTYNKFLGSFAMHAGFERKGGENVNQKEWVKIDRQEEKGKC